MKNYSYDYEWDIEYCYPNSNVLKNKLNITNSDDLATAEREITSIKLAYAKQNVIDIKDNIQRVRELMFDKNDLAKLENKIQALEEYNNTYRGTNLLMLTSTTLLRDAINRGESFKRELDTLVSIGGKNKIVLASLFSLE